MDDALRVALSMQTRQMHVDAVSFQYLIRGYLDAGDVQSAAEVFRQAARALGKQAHTAHPPNTAAAAARAPGSQSVAAASSTDTADTAVAAGGGDDGSSGSDSTTAAPAGSSLEDQPADSTHAVPAAPTLGAELPATKAGGAASADAASGNTESVSNPLAFLGYRHGSSHMLPGVPKISLFFDVVERLRGEGEGGGARHVETFMRQAGRQLYRMDTKMFNIILEARVADYEREVKAAGGRQGSGSAEEEGVGESGADEEHWGRRVGSTTVGDGAVDGGEGEGTLTQGDALVGALSSEGGEMPQAGDSQGGGSQAPGAATAGGDGGSGRDGRRGRGRDPLRVVTWHLRRVLREMKASKTRVNTETVALLQRCGLVERFKAERLLPPWYSVEKGLSEKEGVASVEGGRAVVSEAEAAGGAMGGDSGIRQG